MTIITLETGPCLSRVSVTDQLRDHSLPCLMSTVCSCQARGAADTSNSAGPGETSTFVQTSPPGSPCYLLQTIVTSFLCFKELVQCVTIERSANCRVVILPKVERVCWMMKHPWNLLPGVLLTTTTVRQSYKTWMNRVWPCLRNNIWIFTADTTIASLFGISGSLFC